MICKNENGAALPLILIVIFVISVLGFILITYSITETQQVALDENRLKAHYVARSGAHAMLTYLIENPEKAEELFGAGQSVPVQIGDGEFRVEVIDTSEADKTIHRIRSTGVVNGVVQNINIDLEFHDGVIDSPLYASTINISGVGGQGIRGGDVVYTGNPEDLTEAQRAQLETLIKDGELRVLSVTFHPVILPCDDPELESTFGSSCPAKQVFRDHFNPRHNIVINNTNRYYDKIEIANQGSLLIQPAAGQNLLIKADIVDIGNTTLTVRLENNVVALVVTEAFWNNGNVHVESVNNQPGYFLIYVKDYNKGVGGGNRIFKVDEEVYLNVYVLEDGTFNMRGTPNFNGSIYGPQAKAILRGNAAIVGWVVAGDAEGAGGMDIQYSPIKSFNTSMASDSYSTYMWRYD